MIRGLRDHNVQPPTTAGGSDPEAQVISILGEPASRAMIDAPGLYWCYGSDSWKQWELGDCLLRKYGPPNEPRPPCINSKAEDISATA
ncbi:MAG TPA: hypothetical protein PLP21_11935 [Pyrinomonadaceae bacterium]|nr:hypothetical protein [Acidobacteriota bacterium]HQZ97020.1 hypothetical protein [Pyrinomonadaceae bacterium]